MAGRARTRARLNVPPGMSVRAFLQRPLTRGQAQRRLRKLAAADLGAAIHGTPAPRISQAEYERLAKLVRKPKPRRRRGPVAQVGRRKYDAYYEDKVLALKNSPTPPANPWAVAHTITRRHFNKLRRQKRQARSRGDS